MKRVVWSVVGSGGFSSPTETKEVLELARSTPNATGVVLDDFFTGQKQGKRAQWTTERWGIPGWSTPAEQLLQEERYRAERIHRDGR